MGEQRKLRSIIAIVMGLLVAVSTSLLTIDWAAFDIKKEWPKLLLSSIIAAGGFLSRIKEVKPRVKKIHSEDKPKENE